MDVISQALAAKEILPRIEGGIVLYGAGSLGRFTLRAMRAAGLNPICFCDSSPSMWGEEIEGVAVLPLGMIRRDATFVVTIYTGGQTRKKLRQYGLNAVSFAQFYRAKLLGHKGVTMPYGALDYADNIRAQEPLIRMGYKVWADEKSRREYLAQVRYRVSVDDECLPFADDIHEMYFPPEHPFRESETFVDCGAFDGDTVNAFLSKWIDRVGNTQHRIVAIEPDPKNAEKVRRLKGVEVVEAAVGNVDGEVTFLANGNLGSAISPEGNMTVKMLKLDTILEKEVPTRLKLDIEGAEPLALQGAVKTLQTHRPMLAVCLYHQPEHLWEIPLYLKQVLPEYKLHLRRYCDDCWELVCYASA